MTTSTRRYLVPLPRLDQEVDCIKIAIAKSYQLALETPVKPILLLTPTDDQLRRSTLVEAIGTSATAALLAGQQVAIADGVYLSHDSERTFRDRWTRGVILAVFAGKSMLDKVDDCPRAHAVVVLPGRMDQASEWARAWNPEIVGEPPKSAPKPNTVHLSSASRSTGGVRPWIKHHVGDWNPAGFGAKRRFDSATTGPSRSFGMADRILK